MSAALPHVVVIPGTFAADHFDRCGLDQEEGGRAVIRSRGRRWTVELNAAALANLSSDAAYYADPYGPDLLPPGLRASAQRTVKALARQAA